MRKHCINWHFFKLLNQIWPKGTLIVAHHFSENAKIQIVYCPQTRLPYAIVLKCNHKRGLHAFGRV